MVDGPVVIDVQRDLVDIDGYRPDDLVASGKQDAGRNGRELAADAGTVAARLVDRRIGHRDP